MDACKCVRVRARVCVCLCLSVCMAILQTFDNYIQTKKRKTKKEEMCFFIIFGVLSKTLYLYSFLSLPINSSARHGKLRYYKKTEQTVARIVTFSRPRRVNVAMVGCKR